MIGRIHGWFYSRIADNRNPGSYSARLRNRRFKWFQSLLTVRPTDRILDVGGTEQTWVGSGLEPTVTLLNLDFEQPTSRFQHVVGDGSRMTFFRDRSFDVIYSNSVIEHVGRHGQQELFAAEIRRVGKRYWVQTPNKHFPLEPHFLFPLFQYLPESWQLFVARHWKYSHYRRTGGTGIEDLRRMRLLTKRELARLFPDAQIVSERVFGMSKSLIAYRS